MTAELFLYQDLSVSLLNQRGLSECGAPFACISHKRNITHDIIGEVKWTVGHCIKFFHTRIIKDYCMNDTYLAISALRLASSAKWLSSEKLVVSLNNLVSGTCRPWRVLWACAHLSSRCSLPKSFCLVKAICKSRGVRRISKPLMSNLVMKYIWSNCEILPFVR